MMSSTARGTLYHANSHMLVASRWVRHWAVTTHRRNIQLMAKKYFIRDLVKSHRHPDTYKSQSEIIFDTICWSQTNLFGSASLVVEMYETTGRNSQIDENSYADSRISPLPFHTFSHWLFNCTETIDRCCCCFHSTCFGRKRNFRSTQKPTAIRSDSVSMMINEKWQNF